MNGMFTIAIVKEILSELREFPITYYSTNESIAKYGNMKVFEETNDKLEFGRMLHEFYAGNDWIVFIEASEKNYGFKTGREFSRITGGYVREAIEVYLNPVINKTYGLSIKEQDKSGKDSDLWIITDTKHIYEIIRNITVIYVGNAYIRRKECTISVLGE